MQTVAQRKTATKSRGPARKTTKAASHKTKSSCGKSTDSKQAVKPGDVEVTVDRRRPPGRRTDEQENVAAPVNTLPTRLERRKKVNRRRQIDPTTCERDYSDDEVQFMNALEQYKRASGRMFPTCSEVLEVVRSLGYVRLSASELAARPQAEAIAPYSDASNDEESLEDDSFDIAD
jgi:hypothetical protein